jgi:hypothetical protein
MRTIVLFPRPPRLLITDLRSAATALVPGEK